MEFLNYLWNHPYRRDSRPNGGSSFFDFQIREKQGNTTCMAGFNQILSSNDIMSFLTGLDATVMGKNEGGREELVTCYLVKIGI